MTCHWQGLSNTFPLKSRPQTGCHLERHEAGPHSHTCLPWHHTRPLTHISKPLPEDARKTLLQKQPPAEGTNLGAWPDTMMTTATAQCLSVAEYCWPVWACSRHRKFVDTTLNDTCRLIPGCISPTATPDVCVLSGIAPPEIRRRVHSQNESTKQLTDQQHNLHHHQPVNSRLLSRNSFISTSQPILCKPAEVRVANWQGPWEETDRNLKKYDIHQKERLPSCHTLLWRAWRKANRVRSGQAATLAAKHLWGYQESRNSAALPHAITSIL